jgi:hypothetical protein
MLVPVNGHSLPLLPALDGLRITVEVRRNFFPRIQPVFWRFRGWQWGRGRFAHQRSPDWSAVIRRPPTDCNAVTKPRQSTALDGKRGKRAISVHCRFVATTELSDSRICAIRRREAGERAAKTRRNEK